MKATSTIPVKGRMAPPFAFHLPLERIAPLVFQALAGACGISSGRSALDCVEAPPALPHAATARTRRLIRQARISPW